MSDAQLQAGQYELVSVYLKNYRRTTNIEISNLISGFTINESLSSPFMYGKTTVFDGLDIMTTFPIIGEEFIEFTYKDFYGDVRKDEFMVYSVTDIVYPQESNPTMLQYTLNYVSVGKILTDGYRIMKGYRNGAISDTDETQPCYIKSVFDEYYKANFTNKGLFCKELKILSKTDGPINLVVPNYTPSETFLFLARHAFNSNSKTQTFRFFENRDSYYFGTNEDVKNRYGNGSADPRTMGQLPSGNAYMPLAQTYIYNYLPDMQPSSAYAQMDRIIEVNFGEKVNTANDIRYGAYQKRIGQIDLLNGTAQTLPTYSIQQDFTEKNEKLPHTGAFIRDVMPNKYVRYVIKDYAVGGEPTGPEIKYDMKYADLYDRKGTYLYHYKQNSIDITTYGKNRVVAGAVINVQLPLRKIASSDDNNPIDIERSGYYLADTVQNIFRAKTYTQKITLSRYGIGMK